MSASRQIVETLKAMAALHGRELNEFAATMLLGDLAGYPEAEVLTALTRCRKELRGFPSLADILARIPTGHPGVEEAWALLPHDEAATVVWTPIMQEAWGIARPAGDDIAMRMAFKEVYSRLLGEAVAMRLKPNWQLSLGHDPEMRRTAITEAVRQGKLDAAYANRYLPEPIRATRLAIAGPTEETSPEQVKETVADILKLIGAKDAG